MRLHASDLVSIRGGREVFSGLELAVQAGEALAVTGANGTGKSTLLRLIAGLLAPEHGSIALDGGSRELTIGEQAHYLGHQDALKLSLTAAENIEFWIQFLGGRAGGTGEALNVVGLAELADLPAAYLSAGQRRRLSIARLVAIERPVWLLDEPTAALDAAAEVMLATLLGEHLATGGLILAATHGAIGLDGARELRLEATRAEISAAIPHGPAAPAPLPAPTESPAAGKTAAPEWPSLTASLWALMLRDVRLAMRVGGGALTGVLFFLIVVTLVPFAIGPDLALLNRVGPAILWLGALLASLLALDRLLASDQEDGSLDLILMGRTPLELAIAAKAVAHWLTTGLPLVIATPLLGLLLNLDPAATAAVALTLLVGTPALTFTGLIGAGLTVALRRGGLLLAVLVLPLTVPALIFGVAASDAAVIGPVPFGAPFAILCALTLASFVIGPFAAAAAIRQGLE